MEVLILINDEDSFEEKIDNLYHLMDIIEDEIDTLSAEQAINDEQLLTQPDWSKAPKWANWWAVDSEKNEGWFFEDEPMLEAEVLEHDFDSDSIQFAIYWNPVNPFACRFEQDDITYPYYNMFNFHKSLTKRPA